MPSFDTVLVANRGEIACRIMRSAKALGLSTVAVYSDADRGSPHVRMADRSVRIGEGPARDSYLRVDRILDAAASTGAGAIHPGYGFLSESVELAMQSEGAGLVFVGPTTAQLRVFGQKHTARQAAAAAGVQLVPGSELLSSLDEAVTEATRIGWPVMLKATSGGGGIGMQACRDADELARAFLSVVRAAEASFGEGGVFLEALIERARHVEIQLFGDGQGRVLALGDRDCSLQRRNQKVIEEAPAPRLEPAVRTRLASGAVALGTSVAYRSAGTVEYVYDAERERAYFLEVNTRLQVEHGVTEAIFGVDLVAWMLRLALGDTSFLDEELHVTGHAIEARIYAEDPAEGYRPSSGTITDLKFAPGVRIDSWVERGTEVSPFYDPLLAKVIAHERNRDGARRALRDALVASRVDGIETNLEVLRQALEQPDFLAAAHTTATLATVKDTRPRIDVLSPGTLTTVQDWPGRLGYWRVGVPPSGPMDDLSFRLGNVALGNAPGAPGLEAVLSGPALLFRSKATVCVTGAPVGVSVGSETVEMWTPITVPAGATLEVGDITGPGLRVYVLFAGGLDVPDYLGSASTFTLGVFGGHGGRAIRTGDVLRPQRTDESNSAHLQPGPIADALRPEINDRWEIGVLEGPHGAPEFFTDDDLVAFYEATWQVHFNSARTGVRLIGPAPRWSRRDGGEAGLHPSNIHDTAYALATVDYTGDTPILLGPDGPSLGGFVCPATVAIAERWKLGQLRPGDRVRFIPIREEMAAGRRGEQLARIGRKHNAPVRALEAQRESDGGVLHRLAEEGTRPEVTYRRQGDDHLLVEYGSMRLDFGLRLRVHSLEQRLQAARVAGIIDLTPGIRSLQLHFDPEILSSRRALAVVRELEDDLPASAQLAVESRVVHLPLSWDDPATREAIARYMAGVREDAPWCPWNIEFIRRVNGLDSVEDVEKIVHAAEYLVLGLGDVYLGAPVATPVDPRHRLVTTKYNPARTWTPENAVGIGGAYLCIYGMEGPGGYQFVGRTVQVWNRWHGRSALGRDVPWLLRDFDRICWYPVGAEELLELRADMAAGRLELSIEDGTFRLADHEAFLQREASSIEQFSTRQQRAFAEERERWQQSGEFDRVAALEQRATESTARLPTRDVEGNVVVAPMNASVWRVEVTPGQLVEAGAALLTLEAMKLEVPVTAPFAGRVTQLLVDPGMQVAAGESLVVVDPVRPR